MARYRDFFAATGLARMRDRLRTSGPLWRRQRPQRTSRHGPGWFCSSLLLLSSAPGKTATVRHLCAWTGNTWMRASASVTDVYDDRSTYACEQEQCRNGLL
jgi:hypothetical protein